MGTKNARVRRLVSSHEYKQALRICKDWTYQNPLHREILRRGYDCLMYPDFYKQLGYDTEVEYQKAVEILHLIYD